MQWFAKTTRHLDRFGVWYGAFGVLSGAYSWLVGKVTVFGALPWPELMVIGIAAALVTMLAVTASLAMWRLFKPIPLASLSRNGGDLTAIPAPTTAAEPSPAALAPFDAKGLYVGTMQVDTQHLDERRVIEVVARGFNATGHTIDVQRVAGVIHASEFSGDIVTPLGNLPPPWVIEGRTATESIHNLSEFMFVLEQRVPLEVVDSFKQIGKGRDLRLEMASLDVFCVSQEDPKQSVRVPLWNNMRIARNENRLHFDRVVTGSAAITLNVANAGGS